MSNILVKNCTIVTMTGESDVFKGEIAITGDTIKEVASKVDTQSWKPDKIIDAEGMVALPGFVNCHTHAAMTLFRGYADDMPLKDWLEKKIWPLEKKLSDEDVYWGSMLSILEMIKSGTTTFADMYFGMDEVAKAVQETGVRANLSVGLIGLFGDDDIVEGVNFVEKWKNETSGRITTAFGPHAPYTCPPKFSSKVVEKSEEFDLGLHIHVAETLQEVEDIKKEHGKSPVEYLDDLGVFNRPTIAAHCVHIEDKDIELFKKKNVGVVHNPESNMKLASGIAPVPKMLDAGVTVALGTDGAASNNNLDMLEEMRSAALIHKVNTYNPTVVNAYESLRMATTMGAKTLNLGEDLGQLKAGMKADMLLIDFEKPHLKPLNNIYAHLVYSALSSDVDTVIVDGKVLMENRNVSVIDEEEVYAEINERMKRITSI